MPEHPFVPLEFERVSLDESQSRARAFYERMNLRRTTRHFSSEPVPRQLIEYAVRTAGTAPSGAHQQPWTFVAVSDPALKAEIRRAAEEEEREFYSGRAPQAWLDALAPLGTDENKPFLEVAPWLIAIFEKSHSIMDDGRRVKNYYAPQSTGIACGMLITALHMAGLATLTHTPSPMNFLNKILARPKDERPFLLLVVGYPAAGVQVPDIRRKPLEIIATFL